ADTIGVFQIESRAQIASLRATQPRNLEDLAIQVALIRPGPIMAGAFHPFMEMRRRAVRGEPVNVHYAHPCLEKVLKETLGVVIFQDQVLEIAMAAAGYTAGEAERLRRAMSRRRSTEVMGQEWPRFREGCARVHRMGESKAREIFDQLLAFAAFGFPKSHSVAFALLAYESAWLHHYYPAEYLAALLNSQPMGFYRPHVLVGDAKRHGLTVRPPAVNASGARCVVESNSSIRLGLDSVSGVGLEQARAIVAEREANGAFVSLFDFTRRTRLKRNPIEALIMGRAFEEFGLPPRELLWQLGLFFVDKQAGQPQLELPTDQAMVRLPRLTRWERLQEDYVQLGLSLELHPLALLRPKLAGLPTSRDLNRLKEGQHIAFAGLVVCRQRPSTASGLVFELLEDELGLTNVVIYSDLFDRERET
ncbi:MAG: error-prone DNA polymerase, partial [Chloroflexota bacterium]|nr:error-prone DNA polymerase [Chloroflexota bacterium]